MSILIKGMEMPKNCAGCFLRVGRCSKRIYMENRPSDCPLNEVPEPHGDLIDRDALLEGEGRYSISLCKEGINVEEILRAKTVIPASEEGET